MHHDQKDIYTKKKNENIFHCTAVFEMQVETRFVSKLPPFDSRTRNRGIIIKPDTTGVIKIKE